MIKEGQDVGYNENKQELSVF